VQALKIYYYLSSCYFYYFSIYNYKRGAGSQIDTSSIKNKQSIPPYLFSSHLCIKLFRKILLSFPQASFK
jgi:hypothetical protein